MDARHIPDDLAAQGAERIAFGSTAGFVPRARFTDLAVYFLHDADSRSKPWVAEIVGRSTVPGETDRVNRLCSGTLERALRLIDTDGAIGVAVGETAREWAEDNRVAVENSRRGPVAFDTDDEALSWLYGEPDKGHGSYATMLARDTGAGASTVRMQMAAGRAVMVPLRAVLPFVDREAFRRARAAGAVTRG